jgi:type I restriction enzyme S subunit
VPRSSREDNHNQLGESLDKYQRVLPNDLVFNKLRTWQGGFGISQYEGIVSPAYIIARPDQLVIDPKFLGYLLKSKPYLAELTRLSKWMPPTQFDISWESIRDLKLRIPQLSEQSEISAYLDKEMEKIDRIIKLRELQIKEIRSWLQNTISETIQEASQKGTAPVSYFCSLTNGFPFDSDTFALSGDMPLVRIRDLTATEFELFVPNPIPPSAVIQNGDLLIGMDGQFVPTLWTRGPAALNQRVCALRVKTSADLRFIRFAVTESLQLYSEQVEVTTVAHISSGAILKLRVPNVDFQGQFEIANKLTQSESIASAVISSLSKSCSALSEYKTSLVTACVTGVFDTSDRSGVH